jgi:hypothetical protein
MGSSSDSGGDSSVPSADSILQKPDVQFGTVQSVAATGIRGLIYSTFLFIISIITGFIDIITSYLRSAAGGVGEIMAGYLGGIAQIIEAGAIQTANNFLLPGPFGFVEGLVWTFVGIFIVVQMLEMFGTDVIGLPGFDVIPFFGEEADDE